MLLDYGSKLNYKIVMVLFEVIIKGWKVKAADNVLVTL